MNILFYYSNTIDPLRGGVQNITYMLADAFEKKGHRCFFLSRNMKEKIDDQRQYIFPSKVLLSIENILYYKQFLEDKHIDLIINQAAVHIEDSRLILNNAGERKKISVIHNSITGNVINCHKIYEFVCTQSGKKIYLKVLRLRIVRRVLLFFYKLKYKNHYRYICNQSDRVVMLSKASKNEMRFFVGHHFDAKLISIPNFINIPKFNETKLVKRKKLLYVGRIDNFIKRVDILVSIWKKIYKDYPDWEFNIVGGGQGLDILKNITSGVERIYFTGFMSPQKYYEESSIFCFSSMSEGFGLVLLEAMSYGVIPIAFNSSPSMTSIIDDGINGCLIDNFNLNNYIFELKCLMDSFQNQKERRIRCMEKAAMFSPNNIIPQWVELLKSI